ncbi:putative membrane protein [Vibrio cholerae]|nr:putative membrane protein [Vibrio cholerae]
MSIFISLPLLNKPISALSVVGGVLSLSGLAYMLGEGNPLFFLHQSVTEGDALMVMAALVYALYCVLLKRWKMPFSNWTLIYLQGVCAVFMLIPLWLTSDTLLPTEGSLSLIAYAGIAASLLAPWMWVKAIDAIGADSTAMFMNLLPVFSVSLAATLLGEKVHPYHLIGGLLVISGVALSQLKIQRRNDDGVEKVTQV